MEQSFRLNIWCILRIVLEEQECVESPKMKMLHRGGAYNDLPIKQFISILRNCFRPSIISQIE